VGNVHKLVEALEHIIGFTGEWQARGGRACSGVSREESGRHSPVVKCVFGGGVSVWRVGVELLSVCVCLGGGVNC
jgi:hypothetical protein